MRRPSSSANRDSLAVTPISVRLRAPVFRCLEANQNVASHAGARDKLWRLAHGTL